MLSLVYDRVVQYFSQRATDDIVGWFAGAHM